MTPAMSSSRLNSTVLLSDILYRLTDEEKKEIAERTKKIFKKHCNNIDYGMTAAFNHKSKALREDIINKHK